MIKSFRYYKPICNVSSEEDNDGGKYSSDDSDIVTALTAPKMKMPRFDYEKFIDETTEDKLQKLKELFPHTDKSVLKEVLSNNTYLLQNSIDELLFEKSVFLDGSKKDGCTSSRSLSNDMPCSSTCTSQWEVPNVINSLDSALSILSKRLNKNVKTLDVSPENIFTDVMAYYKSAYFDASHPLRIRLLGQPAADTGGVLRHCYTDVFDFFQENWFIGEPTKYLSIDLIFM